MAEPIPPPLAEPTSATRRRRLVWRVLLGMVALVLLALLATGAGTLWLLRDPDGTRWWLSRVPGVTFEGARGALLGDGLKLQRLVWEGDSGRLQIDDLALERPAWTLRPGPAQWLRLELAALSAARIQWTSAPARERAAAGPPTSLRLPFALVAPVRVAALQVDALPPMTDVYAQLAIGADSGATHRVERLALRWPGGTLRDVRLQLGTDKPLAIEASGHAAGAPGAGPPWQATVAVAGTLPRLGVGVRLAGDSGAAADLKATVRPFEAWPLAALSGRTQALDLSTLSTTWPQTRIDARVDVDSSGRDQPIRAELTLHNRQPGRVDEGRLPIERADAQIGGRLDAPDRIEIRRLVVMAADSSGPAGRIEADGAWQGHTLALQLRTSGLRPRRLDGRAPAMTLSGPLKLDVEGLPSPDPAASAAAGGPLRARIDARLDGRLDAAPKPVTLTLHASVGADELRLDPLLARAGDARLELRAVAQREGARWTVRPQATLTDFDPALWWPGPEGSAWRRGPHRLNGTLDADLSLPADAAGVEAAIGGLRGGAALELKSPSQLAGVPLQGRLVVDEAPASHWLGSLDVAGNRMEVDARVDLAGPGADDRWQLALKAPALARLAPLFRLHPTLAPWAPAAGAVDATVELRGRTWSSLSTTGRAQLRGLRAGALEVAQAQGDWAFGLDAAAPLKAHLDLGPSAWNGEKLQAARLRLDGTRAAHRLELDAALPLQPPSALTRSLALAAASGTRIVLRAEGGLTAAGDGQRWAGVVQEIGASPWDGRWPPGGIGASTQVAVGTAPAATAASAASATAAVNASSPAAAAAAGADARGAPWLQGRDLRVEFTLGADGRLRQLRADAGRLQLAGGLGVRWDQIVYGGPGGALQLRATVDSFRAAPLLARWQPDLGWDGDLEIGARLELTAAERFDAELVIERERGDLRVLVPGSEPLALGLTDLRLALSAHDGTWYFTQALAGRALGEAGGALRVRTAATRRWPAPDDPLDGTLQARVANLDVWGAWIPAGWRLQGELTTTASFGGRFGAPEVTGVLEGRGIGVRNLLEGVAVRDGEVRVRLAGETASIERFVARAGEGQLTVSGGATLGADPQARLTLKAERFQVLGRIDRRVIASGNADLTLSRSKIGLDGRFQVDEGLFDLTQSGAPTLDADVVVVRRGDRAAEFDVTARRALPPPERDVDVAVQVDLGDALRVRGRGIDTLVTGLLRVTAPKGQLAINGTVRTVGGTYAAYGQKLELQRGQLSFSGPLDNPRIDVLARRPDLDVEVGVAITGTALSPRIRLQSVPDMSDADKLSWLVLGRDPGGLGRSDTALVQQAAFALLGGEGQTPDNSLIRRLGLDTLSLRESDGEVRETIVTIGKQLSSRWYIGYERGVNTTVGTWQLIYRIAQRFTLRLQSGLEDAVDAIWTWRVP